MIAALFVMGIAIVGAVLAVTQASIVRAIFGLGIALGGVALAFLLLGSPFLAAMEVLIYIGGITVAMAFGVMLSSIGRDEPREGARRRALAAIGAAIFFVCVLHAVRTSEFTGLPDPDPRAPEAWSVEAIGFELLDQFNVAFEVLSVVLLLAIVGAISIASRADDHADPTAAEENES